MSSTRLDAKGLAPSITINDEVLFAAPSGGADQLKECMREAVTAIASCWAAAAAVKERQKTRGRQERDRAVPV